MDEANSIYFHDARGYRHRGCKTCRAKTTKAYDQAHPRRAYARAWKCRLQTLYGISLADYNRLSAQQEGRCGICKRIPDQRLCVDHDHASGKVRGLLCKSCNWAIGRLGDTPESIRRALAYLGA